MREESAEELLRRIAAGEASRCLLPWLPLTRGGDSEPVADGWKLAAAAEPDPRLRATYAALARTLAEVAGRGDFWDKTLEGWEVKESPVILEWLEEGLNEGRLNASRENVNVVLETRFGSPLPSDLAARIDAENDLDVLRDWLRKAAAAASLDEFTAAIAPQPRA